MLNSCRFKVEVAVEVEVEVASLLPRGRTEYSRLHECTYMHGHTWMHLCTYVCVCWHCWREQHFTVSRLRGRLTAERTKQIIKTPRLIYFWQLPLLLQFLAESAFGAVHKYTAAREWTGRSASTKHVHIHVPDIFEEQANWKFIHNSAPRCMRGGGHQPTSKDKGRTNKRANHC